MCSKNKYAEEKERKVEKLEQTNMGARKCLTFLKRFGKVFSLACNACSGVWSEKVSQGSGVQDAQCLFQLILYYKIDSNF